ncbi:exosortase N [Pedobacter frigoris]|nr:exosortase N [Pedobacter frigoris]
MKITWLIICLSYVVIAIRLFNGYIQWDISLYIGLAIVPFVFSIEKGILSTRFLIPTLICAVFALFIPTRSTLFFTLVFTMLLLFESFKGRINMAFFFVLILISPIFKFFSDTLGFPLRLWLSTVVAESMAFAGMHARANGNMISIDNYDFYIDQACAGLNMLNVSMLLCLFIISYHQKKTNTQLHFLQLMALLLITFSFNVLSNFFRIMAIVIFKIMPGTAMHEIIGVVCMMIYVILPLIWFIRIFVQRLGKLKPVYDKESHYRGINPILKFQYLQLLLFAVVTYLSITTNNVNQFSHNNSNRINLSGYKKTCLANKVLKFENKEALIYIKPTPFYAPEHNPMICWRGSGYEFQFIKKDHIKGIEIYTGILAKGKDRIYASWWFDNGKIKTVSQFSWRWNGVKSNNFYLVNVNASRPEDLKRITATLLPSPFAGNL